MAEKTNSRGSEFLQRMRDQFTQAKREEAQVRQDWLEDQRYHAGIQWPEKDAREREKAGRPALVFNKLQGFVQMLSNEARQNKPTIGFSPVDDKADPDTAEILGGIARHIQYDSDSDVANETAVEHAAGGGFGYTRLVTDYCDGDSFDQDLKERAVLDPMTVYGVLIPFCRGQKARFAFVIESLTKDEYKVQYPKSKLEQCGFDTEADGMDSWYTHERVQVAEYWWIETVKRTICLLRSGQVVAEEDVQVGDDVVRTRTRNVDVVRSLKTNGYEIFEKTETEWIDDSIPIFPTTGKVMILDGRIHLFSLIRFARHPQQMINYVKSRIVELLATSPISPFLAANGAINGFEDEWEEAHKVPTAVLTYNLFDASGRPIPKPERQVYEPPIQALANFGAMESDDLKQATSIFDASLGAESNETSGIALHRRQMQSSLANMHFLDNLTRKHRAVGRVLARAIPKIYDAERMVRILGEDETAKVVWVNREFADPETGKVRYYRLDAGKYDVTVKTGPSYTSKRQEAFDLLTQMAQAYPDLVKIGGDIIFRNADIPGMDELAKRFKKTIPAELTDDETNGGAPDPAQLQQQLVAVSQQLQATQQQLAAATQAASGKILELKAKEVQSTEDRELKREQMYINAAIELAKLGHDGNIVELREKLAQLRLDAQRSAEQYEASEATEPQNLDLPPAAAA